MSQESLNWDDLRVIAAIGRSRSFGRAAKDLRIDETTVARRLARIESALGAVLFDAVDGERRPSERCRSILGELVAIERRIEDIHGLARGTATSKRCLRLSTICAIGEHVIAPELDRLLAIEPDLSIVLDTTDQNLDMSRWETDFAIRLGRPNHGAFTMRKIGLMRFCLVRPRTPATDEPLVVGYPEMLSGTPEMKVLARIAGPGAMRLRTSNLNVIVELVSAGRAIGVAPQFLAGRLRRDERLTVSDLEEGRELSLLGQTHLRDDRLARRVADWCAALFAEWD